MKVRIQAVLERLRSSLWVVPTIAVLAALVAGTALARVRVPPGPLQELVFTGSASGARELLSTVAGAMITTTGLVFSLTVVALQMAAGQYSPRVMRNFLRDRGNQVVLAGFLATFAYAVAVLRTIRADGPDMEGMVPSVAVTGGILLSLVSLGLLVYFIQHLTSSIRVEEILRKAERTALATIETVYGARDTEPARGGLPEVPEEATAIPAPRSGYLQAVQVDALVPWAVAQQLVLRLRPTVGSHVVEGTVVAWAWRPDGQPPLVDPDAAARRLDGAMSIGFERTNQQDVSFGLRQVVDIAVRALSTGVNDPTTAVEAIGHLSVLLTELARRKLGDQLRWDADGVLRVALPRPGLAQYLNLCCDQIRRYGAHEPAVVTALLRMLVDVAGLARDEPARTAIAHQSRLLVEDAHRETPQAADLAALPHLADLVAEALRGRTGPEPVFAS